MPARNTVHFKPLTPEERAKQAERRALIGNKGEKFVMKHEKDRLHSLGIKDKNYPKHVALESMSHGYDILSIDENNSEIYIEVKTTTRAKDDSNSKWFYLSTNEYNKFNMDKPKYRLYRIYNIENEPELDIVNLDSVTKKPDGYIINY